MVTNVLGRGQLSWTVAENRTWRLKGTTGFHSQFAPYGAPSASTKGVLLCGGAGVACDEATTVPVDHEAVPGQAESEDMMAPPVERELVFRA